jgi:hypothetical protein
VGQPTLLFSITGSDESDKEYHFLNKNFKKIKSLQFSRLGVLLGPGQAGRVMKGKVPGWRS